MKIKMLTAVGGLRPDGEIIAVPQGGVVDWHDDQEALRLIHARLADPFDGVDEVWDEEEMGKGLKPLVQRLTGGPRRISAKTPVIEVREDKL